MPACTNCGNQNSANLKFCTACGTPLNAATSSGAAGRSCSACGASIPATVKFCLQCGKPAVPDAPPPPVAAPPQPKIPPPPIAPAPVAAPVAPMPEIPPQIVSAPIVPLPPVLAELPAEPSRLLVSNPPVEPAKTQPELLSSVIAPPPAPPSAPRNSLAVPIAAVVILILAISGGGYYGYSVWTKSRAQQSQASAPPAQPAAPIEIPKPAASQPVEPPPIQIPPAKKTSPSTVSRASHPAAKAAIPVPANNSTQLPPAQPQTPQSAPPPPPAPIVPAITNGARAQVRNVTPIRTVPLQYPPLAKSARITGDVRLRIVIGTNGAVKDVSVISGNPILAKAAVDAVRQWLYRPIIVNGNIAEVETETTITFSL